MMSAEKPVTRSKLDRLRGSAKDPDLTPASALKFLSRGVVSGHTQDSLLDRWASYYPDPARILVFTETGLARLAATAGYIVGLDHASCTEMAAALAYYFVSTLDRLAVYGGPAETPAGGDAGNTREVPRYRIELRDDGTFGGFGVTWYGLVSSPREELAGVDLLKLSSDHITGGLCYRRSFHGGLLFHGFDESSGGSPTFAVRIGDDPNPWSIHT